MRHLNAVVRCDGWRALADKLECATVCLRVADATFIGLFALVNEGT